MFDLNELLKSAKKNQPNGSYRLFLANTSLPHSVSKGGALGLRLTDLGTKVINLAATLRNKTGKWMKSLRRLPIGSTLANGLIVILTFHFIFLQKRIKRKKLTFLLR